MRLGFLVFFLLVVALTLFIVAFSVFMHGEVACGDFSDFKRMVRTFPKVEGTVTAADSRSVLPVSATGLATPLFGSDASSRRPLGGNRVAICVRIRNEAPNLAEWLAFHMAVGISKVIVMDDGSTDNPRAKTLPFEHCNFAEYHIYNISEGAGPGRPNSEPVRKQMEPLNECMAHLRRNCEKDVRWLALIDADEFLYPYNSNKTISAVFELLEKYHCVTVPRIQFGSAGHVQRPDGLTIRAFQQRTTGHFFKSNRYPKLVVNLHPRNASLRFQQLTNMHTPPGKSQRNRGPNPCFGWPYKDQQQELHTKVRLNHYLRSVEDFNIKLKHHFPNSEKYSGFLDVFLERDENEVHDASASKWGIEVDAILKRLFLRSSRECDLKLLNFTRITPKNCY